MNENETADLRTVLWQLRALLDLAIEMGDEEALGEARDLVAEMERTFTTGAHDE